MVKHLSAPMQSMDSKDPTGHWTELGARLWSLSLSDRALSDRALSQDGPRHEQIAKGREPAPALPATVKYAENEGQGLPR